VDDVGNAVGPGAVDAGGVPSADSTAGILERFTSGASNYPTAAVCGESSAASPHRPENINLLDCFRRISRRSS
jgi:hypothetical protein